MQVSPVELCPQFQDTVTSFRDSHNHSNISCAVSSAFYSYSSLQHLSK